MDLLVSLLGGGVGANLLGALMKGRSMGPMWNTILGAVGGVLGGQFLGGPPEAGMGRNALVSAVCGILLALVGSFLKKRRVA
jgi:hypothetical protein